MSETEGFTEPDDGPVYDVGYMSLPAETQRQLEHRVASGITRWRKLPVEVDMIRWDGSDEAAQLIAECSGHASPGSWVMRTGGQACSASRGRG